jgi:hypothetical protein
MTATPPEEPGSAAPTPTMTAEAAPAKPKLGIGTWAGILGAAGILFALIPHVSGFGIFVALVGLVLGLIGLKRKPGRAKLGVILSAIGLVLGAIFSGIYGVATTPVNDSSALEAAPSDTTAATDATTQAEAPTPSETPSPAAPAATTSQEQALISAQSYLSMGSGFSQAGLLAQLTSSYGEGFPAADAQWAIDHVGADWNAQAVLSAKGYLAMGGFSRAKLIDQLSSPYGGQFTPEQAAYAADQVGL